MKKGCVRSFHAAHRIGSILVLLALGIIPISANAQTTTPFPGLREQTPSVHVLTNARIVVSPGNVIESGRIVIREGIIVGVGAAEPLPADARVWDMDGRTVYAGFFDAYGEAGSSSGRRDQSSSSGDEAEESSVGANYWNDNVTPQTLVSTEFKSDADANETFRSQGVTSRLIAPTGGVIKGRSVLVSTGDGQPERVILRDDVALHGQLTARRGGGYPNSPMGAVALFRQAFYDAVWYADAWAAYDRTPTLSRPEQNGALAVLQTYRRGAKPVVIDASNELFVLRADRVAKELGLDVIVRGSGNEYRRLAEISAAGRPIIIPVDFPEPPDVSTPEMALEASLEELMHWDIAPENAARLDSAGLTIALTSDGLKDKSSFLKNIRTAVQRGLPTVAALRALTTAPATLFGVEDKLGSIETGKLANLVVTDGDVFDEDTEIVETWVDGIRYEVETPPKSDARGTWAILVETPPPGLANLTFKIAGSPDKMKGSLHIDSTELDLKNVALDLSRLAVSFHGDTLGQAGIVQMSASMHSDSLLGGHGTLPTGDVFHWHGVRTEPYTDEPDTNESDDGDADEAPQTASFATNYPLGAFGRLTPPVQSAGVLFKNATVWTCGPQGKIEGGSVLVRDGKIAGVGDLAAPPGVEVVDASGKHITPGMIDCHTHIATDGGINESGQTITAEVRIGDFVDCDDISIYRQLAGGTTSANILHGSANTIGGQNQVMKHRWGSGPEELKFEGAPPGIKFALGENVKQSNWGERFTTRYPQTRMGVEQIVRDEFEAAIDYREAWAGWQRTQTGIPPRRDLELDAIVEILSGERLIHCHSYRQDEILALLRTCEDYDVQIGTFQHILEGYKVADAMANHGVGGSSFSDWWAYKIEVYDAIPYNGALMHNAGVLVSFNSDNAELGRRLNWEASKAVKYGGVPEEEALKFETINPAIQLGIDNRVGSLETGKDADLVVWSGSPLSTLSRCEQTWVDGRRYFSIEEDQQLRARDNTMRARLIQKILDSGGASKSKGGRREGSKWPRHDEFCDHVDHIEEEVER